MNIYYKFVYLFSLWRSWRPFFTRQTRPSIPFRHEYFRFCHSTEISHPTYNIISDIFRGKMWLEFSNGKSYSLVMWFSQGNLLKGLFLEPGVYHAKNIFCLWLNIIKTSVRASSMPQRREAEKKNEQKQGNQGK